MAVLLVAILAFVSLGLPDAVLGVAWPSVRRAFQLPLSALGVLLAFGMSGYLASSFASGPIVTRMGVGRVLLWSSALTAASALGYALAPTWPLVVACALVGGLGAGAIDAGINAHAALHFSARAVNVLHAAYGIGATAGPALMTLLLTHGAEWRTGYAVIAAVLAALAACFAVTLPLWPRAGAPGPREAAAAARPGFGAVLRRPRVALHATLFGVYTGIEATTGQWLYSLLTEARDMSPGAAGTWTTLYWASLTGGRILVGIVAPRFAAVTLLRVSMLGAVAGAALIAVADGPGMGLTGVVMLGLAAGPIYPLLIAETPLRLGAGATAHAVGLQVAAAYVGAAGWPALAGIIARGAGLEVIGPFVVGLGLGLLALHEAALRGARASGRVCWSADRGGSRIVQPLGVFGLWEWIQDNRAAFEPPVGNKVIWEDSQFTAMVIRGPNARRDFHVDPSDEIFYMLRGAMTLETLEQGRRVTRTIREGEMCLVPALTPHSPHRPAETWGLVIEIKRAPTQAESLIWLCERCDATLHEVTMHVADIETQLKAAIEAFDASVALRTCRACGHVQPDRAPLTVAVTADGGP